MKGKSSLLIALGGSPKDNLSEGESSSEGDRTDGEMYAQDLMDAVKARDPKGVYEAIRTLVRQCKEDEESTDAGEGEDKYADKD